MNPVAWKFSRMRSANFPTLRLAQTAELLRRLPNIFQDLVSTQPTILHTKLQASPSEFWHRHYHFGKESKQKLGNLGTASANSLLINAILPLRILYASQRSGEDISEILAATLSKLPPENNKITRLYAELGISNESAYTSQALIEQYNNFCQPKKCLNCQVGIAIMRPAK